MGLDDLNCIEDYEAFEQNCLYNSGNLNCKHLLPHQLKFINCNNNFSLMHLNIRSLSKHHDDLVSLLTNIGHSFKVIGCSETWLNEGSYMDILNLDGYKLYNKNRLGRPGGRVCLYAASELSVTIRDDLIIEDGHSDSLFMEIDIKNSKNIIVGVIYRPPDSDIDNFKIKLEKLLYCINQTNKTCFILGDYNIDLAKDDSGINDFINVLHSSFFFPQ